MDEDSTARSLPQQAPSDPGFGDHGKPGSRPPWRKMGRKGMGHTGLHRNEVTLTRRWSHGPNCKLGQKYLLIIGVYLGSAKKGGDTSHRGNQTAHTFWSLAFKIFVQALLHSSVHSLILYILLINTTLKLAEVIKNFSWAWWNTLVSPAPGKLRQEDSKFSGSLGYEVTPCLQIPKRKREKGNLS